MKKAPVFLILLIFGCGGTAWRAGGEEMDYYSPENVLRFAEHLYHEGDYLRAAGEYKRYLFYSPGNTDSTLYRIGLCYRLAGDPERALNSFRRVIAEGVESRSRFAASYQTAYTYFLLGQHESSIQFLNQALDKTQNADERGQLQTLAAFNYMHQRRWHDAESVLEPLSPKDENLDQITSVLRASAREGMNLPLKSPLLGGLFSVIVPGAGKAYCKQYGDGLYSLIIIGITGLLAWDGFRENGVRSVRGWLFGSISGIFYAGNVYGSNVAVRIYNRQLETALLKRLPPVPDRVLDQP